MHLVYFSEAFKSACRRRNIHVASFTGTSGLIVIRLLPYVQYGNSKYPTISVELNLDWSNRGNTSELLQSE